MIQGKASEVLTEGAVKFAWLPLVGVIVHGRDPQFRLGPVEIKAKDVSIRGTFDIVQVGSGKTQARSDGDVIINRTTSKSPSLDHVDIHVLNLPPFQGEGVKVDPRNVLFGSLSWRFGEWNMTLDPMIPQDGIAKAAQAIRGNLLTHVIRVRRADSSSFRLKHLEQVLDDLHLALSFAFGDYIGPLLAAGRNKRGDVVLELLRPYPAFGWRLRQGPAPRHSGIGPMMEALGTIFQKPDETLRETVWWLLEACWSMIEASIVLSQAALERLAYHVLVKTRALLKDDAYDALRAEDNIRLLMRVLEIPTKAEAFKIDIPELITKARNSEVHPRRKEQAVQAINVYQLALQTIELAILRLAGYVGPYHPREATHTMDELPVPWSQ